VVANSAEIARSRLFWWRHRRPPEAEGDALAAHQELVERLRELGWEPVGRPNPWYAQRFRRSSEPASEPPAEESEPPAEEEEAEPEPEPEKRPSKARRKT
jgi:hypothetical protein